MYNLCIDKKQTVKFFKKIVRYGRFKKKENLKMKDWADPQLGYNCGHE